MDENDWQSMSLIPYTTKYAMRHKSILNRKVRLPFNFVNFHLFDFFFETGNLNEIYGTFVSLKYSLTRKKIAMFKMGLIHLPSLKNSDLIQLISL